MQSPCCLSHGWSDQHQVIIVVVCSTTGNLSNLCNSDSAWGSLHLLSTILNSSIVKHELDTQMCNTERPVLSSASEHRPLVLRLSMAAHWSIIFTPRSSFTSFTSSSSPPEAPTTCSLHLTVTAQRGCHNPGGCGTQSGG